MNPEPSDRARRGGALIAMVGCDGSGKSTVSRWLVGQLNENVDTQFLYFGTGDGPGSPIRRTLNWLKKRSVYGKAPRVASKDASSIRKPESRRPAAPNYLRLIWAATVARERMSKMRLLRRALDEGTVVVTDRYPQAEFSGIHDGPRLGYMLENRSAGSLFRIAQWENSIYVRMSSCIPDLVILLDVAPKVAHGRRSEESMDELERRIHIARSLAFQGATRIVLDSSEPLQVVQEKALAAVLELDAVRHIGLQQREGAERKRVTTDG